MLLLAWDEGAVAFDDWLLGAADVLFGRFWCPPELLLVLLLLKSLPVVRSSMEPDKSCKMESRKTDKWLGWFFSHDNKHTNIYVTSSHEKQKRTVIISHTEKICYWKYYSTSKIVVKYWIFSIPALQI